MTLNEAITNRIDFFKKNHSNSFNRKIFFKLIRKNIAGLNNMNILLTGFVCPGCFNTFDKNKGEIVNDAFTFNKHTSEIYCNRCGLVVSDTSITTMGILRYLTIRERIYKKSALYKKIQSEKRFIDSFEIVFMYRARKEAKEKREAEERARKREERKAKAKATREKNKKKNKSKKKKKTKKKKK